MSEALDWSYRVTEIPDGGLKQSRDATDAERKRLSEVLDIIAVRALKSEFTVRATGKGHYRLAGKVTADVTQSCVVTLEPIEQSAKGEFDVEFWPAGSLPEVGADEVEALNASEIEPIEHGRIDVGRIVFETVSSSLDPYPRVPGAEFKPGQTQAEKPTTLGPFAALKKLKDQG
jgi:uncharacterized metal-binding protein YceD (DUF177 family)